MSFGTISASQLENYLNHPEYRIVDLRDFYAFEKGHIKGAVHIPFDQYREKFLMLPKNVTYILYCERGGSSLMAARWLDRRGFHTLSLNGGIHSYQGRLYV